MIEKPFLCGSSAYGNSIRMTFKLDFSVNFNDSTNSAFREWVEFQSKMTKLGYVIE